MRGLLPPPRLRSHVLSSPSICFASPTAAAVAVSPPARRLRGGLPAPAVCWVFRLYLLPLLLLWPPPAAVVPPCAAVASLLWCVVAVCPAAAAAGSGASAFCRISANMALSRLSVLFGVGVASLSLSLSRSLLKCKSFPPCRLCVF